MALAMQNSLGGGVSNAKSLSAPLPSTGVNGINLSGVKAYQNIASKSSSSSSSSSSGGSSVSSDVMDLYKVLQEDRALALQSAEATNRFNSEEAQKARDWQEYMSNTSHQREVKDLIAAGLNPVLSANNGANAYTAAMGSGVKADTPSGANALANIMSAAMTSSAMVQVAGVNAASALAVAKQQGTNSMEVAKENHYNSITGTFKQGLEDFAKLFSTGNSAKNMTYKDYLNLYKK